MDRKSLPGSAEGKDFYLTKLEGGECTLAISKARKEEIVTHYVDWIKNSQAVILTEYVGLNMKQIDDLRGKIREAGGEFHIVKNTLGKVAFDQSGLTSSEKMLQGSTAAAFAFKDAPAMAKIMADFAKLNADYIKIKGGYLEKRVISPVEVSALADMPPLPVMRAILMGTLLAPASKLVRTLAEPARQVASVLKSYVDKDSQPASE
jgi:large subunit ribosomal protein L10